MIHLSQRYETSELNYARTLLKRGASYFLACKNVPIDHVPSRSHRKVLGKPPFGSCFSYRLSAARTSWKLRESDINRLAQKEHLQGHYPILVFLTGVWEMEHLLFLRVRVRIIPLETSQPKKPHLTGVTGLPLQKLINVPVVLHETATFRGSKKGNGENSENAMFKTRERGHLGSAIASSRVVARI